MQGYTPFPILFPLFIEALLGCMQEHLELVRTNFQFVFKDILNLDHFENKMLFSDPISKFTFFRGKCSCQ